MSTQPTDAEIWQMCMPMVRRMGVADPVEFARVVLAKWGPPAHSGEPVAWMRDWDVYDPTNSGPEFSHTKKERSKGWDPLYTVPQPVEREPLTRQQLREAFYNDTACTLGGDVDLAEKVCRVVEKAHGIKGGQHGADT